MATNFQQTFFHVPSTHEHSEGTSACTQLLRRGFKPPQSRLRQSCSLSMHRAATSVLIATLFLSALAFLFSPQFAEIRLPQALQSTFPTIDQSSLANSSKNVSLTDDYHQNGRDAFGVDKGGKDIDDHGYRPTKEKVKDKTYGEEANLTSQNEQYHTRDDGKISKSDNDEHGELQKDSQKNLANNRDLRNGFDGVKKNGREVSAQGVREESSTDVDLPAEHENENINGGAEKRKETHDSSGRSSTNSIPSTRETKIYSDPADFSTFTNITTLNYFHLHKTGGVSFKGRLFRFFFTKGRTKGNGEPINLVDTCYISETRRPEMGIEAEWSCNWAKLEGMPVEQRQKIDVIVGHQYWEQGAAYWVPNRDLRYFTVMRHPLHRKISFFYHFFVRNAGRSEDAVEPKEVIEFVLGRTLPRSSLVRDAGPGYYASRLWSDGWSGFGRQHRFVVAESDADDLVYRSIQRLRNHFLFVGLQTQEKASLCMLKKTVLEFARGHRVDDLDGIEDIGAPRERMNTGGYALTAAKLWDQMSTNEREEFKTVERVDLGIYNECLKMFGETVQRFGCQSFVEDNEEDSIAI